MEELVKRLQDNVGLSAEDAQKSVQTVLAFVKEKLPMGLGEKVEDMLNGTFDIQSLLGGFMSPSDSDKDNPLEQLKNMFS